jgi:hypothetical protein
MFGQLHGSRKWRGAELRRVAEGQGFKQKNDQQTYLRVRLDGLVVN